MISPWTKLIEEALKSMKTKKVRGEIPLPKGIQGKLPGLGKAVSDNKVTPLMDQQRAMFAAMKGRGL